MFEDHPSTPRIYAQPIGSDFPAAVVSGVRARMSHTAPEAMARVTLIANSARMRRRIEIAFANAGAGLLPRIFLLSDLDKLLPGIPPKPARHALERKLQLSQLLVPVLRDHPELAPKSSVFSLADSLARLMDEMQGEGVSAADLAALDVADESGHWKFALSLIDIAQGYVSQLDSGQDAEGRQRDVVHRLIDHWEQNPPQDPIILAGSTGSRGATFQLMKAIANLSNGAVILPGFDTHLPEGVWRQMSDAMQFEDHPQFRFAKLLHDLELAPRDLLHWSTAPADVQDRSRVVSLALRPAPVTDAWLSEGPNLPVLDDAMSRVTLIESQTQRLEALAIAARMRVAVERGERVVLISPDRMLGRLVTSSLSRWNILPDDSAGLPLALSAPGRFLRHTADLFLRQLDAETLLTLLKHPLTQSGAQMPSHGLFVQRLELQLRRDTAPSPDAARLMALIEKASKDASDQADMLAWGAWLADTFCDLNDTSTRGLGDWLARHRRLAETIAGGGDGSGGLWDKKAGQEALAAFASLETHAHHAGDMTASDYAQLLSSVLAQGEVRDRDAPHPDVMIWGTLEARVQGCDLVILGALNDGSWPEAPAPDPWLNRRMRHQAGLLLPDRQIGLSAHDFQQAMGAPEVWLTRSVRADGAETVPSRWLNRLINMMAGLPTRAGPQALTQMQARGDHWLAQARALEIFEQVPAAGRAAPKPPISVRPRSFSATEIRKLIRDPYAIYARHCLGLRPLDPLVQEPDAPIRGIVVHEVMERFVKDVSDDPDNLSVAHLMQVADAVLEEHVPWPTAKLMWHARLERAAEWIIASEKQRLTRGKPAALEYAAGGKLELKAIGGSIRARPDRIDLTEDGRAILYDYKSGNPPSPAEQKAFDKQLLIEAAMIENGAFGTLGPREAADAVYIGLGANPKEQYAPLDEETPSETLLRLTELIASYLEPDQHFLSRRMLKTERDIGDYDHLARHGEWDDTDDPAPEDLT